MEIKRQVNYQVNLTEKEEEILFQARDLMHNIVLATGAEGTTLLCNKARSVYLEIDDFLEEYRC